VGAAVKSLKTQAQTPVVLKEPHPIQSATIVSARAMNLHLDSGSIEIGKRADLILVNGNPLKNISDIRKITRVVTNGRLYQSATLWAASGFRAIAK
jgi:imidazolonepropionase-like amidohydrolase